MVLFNDLPAGTYEMDLPSDFSLPLFEKECARGVGKMWLIKIDDKNIVRFKGVIDVGENSVRVFIDIDMDAQCAYAIVPVQDVDSLHVVKLVANEIGATKIYEDGELIFER